MRKNRKRFIVDLICLTGHRVVVSRRGALSIIPPTAASYRQAEAEHAYAVLADQKHDGPYADATELRWLLGSCIRSVQAAGRDGGRALLLDPVRFPYRAPQINRLTQRVYATARHRYLSRIGNTINTVNAGAMDKTMDADSAMRLLRDVIAGRTP